MSADDVAFSKTRIETLCDGIFAIAMTQAGIAIAARRRRNRGTRA